MRKILALWATPRSTSTAFEWMMRQRDDLSCWHEPFGEAWYQGEEPRWPRFEPSKPTTKGLSLESVWENLKKDATAKDVFIKDFPHYVLHMWRPGCMEFDHFTHSFLIRDPAKVLTSMYKYWPDFHLLESAFAEQRMLYDGLFAYYGVRPPVIDSDDLLDNPNGIVQAYCDAVGIPFISEALSWEPSAQAFSWYDGGSWHDNLRGSTGLQRQERKYIDIVKAPDRVQLIYDLVMPHYQYLYQYRLQVK